MTIAKVGDKVRVLPGMGTTAAKDPATSLVEGAIYTVALIIKGIGSDDMYRLEPPAPIGGWLASRFEVVASPSVPQSTDSYFEYSSKLSTTPDPVCPINTQDSLLPEEPPFDFAKYYGIPKEKT